MALPRLALILGLVLLAAALFFILLPMARSASALLMVVGLGVVAIPLIIAAAPKREEAEEEIQDGEGSRPITCGGPRPIGESTRQEGGGSVEGDA